MTVTSHVEIDRVCNAIFQAIFERRLEPNTRLVETQLAKALSSNRSNIRQALLLLEQRKLVEIVPNKGAIVAEPSEKDAAEVFAARLCIELKVLDLVCEQRKAKDLKQLQTHLRKEKQARQRKDRHRLIDLTGRFHLLLAEIAGNQVLLDFLSHLVARSSLILEKYGDKEPSNIADLYAFRGDYDQSFKWLNKAFEIKDPVLVEALTYPSFKPMYGDSRWSDFIKKIGLPKDHGYPLN